VSFDRLAVIGIGLIGGSFALATKGRRLVSHVIGVARSEATRAAALERGIADEATDDPAAAAEDADLIYISTPVGAVASVMEAIAPVISPATLVTDAGSTKASTVALARKHLPRRCTFIGGHPMAGSHESGPQAACADLFEGKTYILTPTDDTPPAALDRLRGILEAIGAKVVLADAKEHDRLVAATSHLPHLIAATLCNSLVALAEDGEALAPFVGSGFRDMTRIAKAPPEVWRDILLDNRDNIREALATLDGELECYLDALEEGDGDALAALLEQARAFRKGLDDE
jgi:prephenate dehydrogenase